MAQSFCRNEWLKLYVGRHQSNKKQKQSEAKQRELDELKQDKALTESAMQQIGAEHILLMAEKVAQSQKPKKADG